VDYWASLPDAAVQYTTSAFGSSPGQPLRIPIIDMQIIRLAHLQCESLLFRSPRLSSVVCRLPFVCCLSALRLQISETTREYGRNFEAFIGNRGRRAKI